MISGGFCALILTIAAMDAAGNLGDGVFASAICAWNASGEDSGQDEGDISLFLPGQVLGETSEMFESVEVPSGFEEEFFSLDGSTLMGVSDSGNVLGFGSSVTAEDHFSQCASDMERKGWRRVESGLATCATFLKEGGEHRWALLESVPVGTGTSTVVITR